VGDAPDGLLDELAAEHAALDAVVADITPSAWDAPTPSPGWRVRDQIGHLAYFDQMAFLSANDPDAFEAGRDAGLADLAAFEAEATSIGRGWTGTELLDIWRRSRAAMLEVLADVPAASRLAWYGPPMSLRSFVTARLMETWAHGQDVVDALGAAAARPPTDRLRHICHLGFSTYRWSFTVRGEEPPSSPVRVDLVLPSGAAWSAGDESAADAVRGSAEDFCLVVTQRRHVSATALDVHGPIATEWMAKAQCFAGGPTLAVPPAGAPTPTPLSPE
jgi:uncharacterized protein (TIGR03084 family)